MLDEIFDVTKKLVRSNHKLYKSLDDNYKNGIMFYMKMIPLEYSAYIIKTYNVIKDYIGCVDIIKILKITAKYNMVTMEIQSEKYIGGFIIDNFSDLNIKLFVAEIIHKLDRIFICIDYAFAHPREIIKNANILVKVEDIF
jgi:hypothetical protein